MTCGDVRIKVFTTSTALEYSTRKRFRQCIAYLNSVCFLARPRWTYHNRECDEYLVVHVAQDLLQCTVSSLASVDEPDRHRTCTLTQPRSPKNSQSSPCKSNSWAAYLLPSVPRQNAPAVAVDMSFCVPPRQPSNSCTCTSTSLRCAVQVHC